MTRILWILLVLLTANFAYAAPTSQPSTNWYDNLFFQDKSFIFEFIRTMGYTYSGGADIGESIATAKKIKDGDINSWYNQWLKTGDRLYQLAEGMQAKKNNVSAREAFFRASNYYRTSGFYMDAPAMREKSILAYQKSKNSFLKAIASLSYIQPITIPYENTTLPGYFIRSNVKNAPLLIVHTGFDGTAEELYFEAGMAAHARGYNVILFEGPGQGEVLREQHLPFRYDWEKVVSPVIDYAMTLPDLDKDKIALLGISFGGYLAPRAAAFDNRIKACIANPGLYDFGESVYKNLPPALIDLLKQHPEEFNKEMYSVMNKGNTVGWFFNHALWVFAANSPADVMLIVKQYSLKDVANKIKCPVLVVSSDEDAFDKNGYQAKQLFNAIKSPKTFLKFTKEEAAQAHCQMGAIGISNELIFNWLDKIFNQ